MVGRASIGDELRKLRESAGLTQEQLSFKAGLSRP
jgi:transcriptional regulator with XRE-family HTH domain